jgi:hypothetical protein
MRHVIVKLCDRRATGLTESDVTHFAEIDNVDARQVTANTDLDHWFRLRNLAVKLRAAYVTKTGSSSGFPTYLGKLVTCKIAAVTPDEKSAQASRALNIKGQIASYLRFYVLSSDSFWNTFREMDRQYRRQNLKDMDPLLHEKVVLVSTCVLVCI